MYSIQSHDTKATARYRTACVYSLGLLITLSPLELCAQSADIRAFELTGVEGNVAARYIYDDYRQDRIGGDETHQTRPTYEQEIYVLTHSYAYHPNLLNMDLGGGLLFIQQDFESDQGDSSSQDILYNLTARLHFLEGKLYPFTLYYDRSNPSVSTSLSGRFLTENTRYGFNATLRQPLLPVTVTMEASRVETDGSGFDTSIDQTTDQAQISAQKSYGRGNSVRLSFLTSEAVSASGSLGLPIQQTSTTTRSTGVDASNYFGDNRQLQLIQSFTYNDQETEQLQNPSIDVKSSRYSTDLRWNHNKSTRSFYQYRFQNSDRSDADTTNHSATIGAAYEPEHGLHGSMDIHGEDEVQDTSGLDRSRYGSLVVAGYNRDIPNGSLHLGMSLLYDRTDQSSNQGTALVIDENITLAGTTAVSLQQDFVISSSIVVTNLASTQTFVENLDYRVITVGSNTEIQRLIGGNILDGETVSVDYQYQTGGTFEFDTFNQSYFLNLRFYRFHELFAQYRDSSQTVVSGAATTPLNTSENILAGVRVEYPFLSGWLVGGEASYEEQDQGISPFTRENYLAYIETLLPRASKLRITGRREFRENENSVEDVDLSQAIIRFTSRPWLRTTLRAEADYEEDIGGSLIRRRIAESIGLDWRYRRLLFSVRAEHINERQGDNERENNKIRAQLIRTF